MSDDDDRARYFGALNRLRSIAADEYGGGGPVIAPPRTTATVGAVILALGAGLIVAAVLALASALAEIVAAVCIGAVGALLAAIGVFLLLVARAARRALSAYEARRADRDRGIAALRALADAWGGSVDTDAIGAGCRFLMQHWPDRALEVLLLHQGGDRTHVEERATLTFALDGCPSLIQVIDLPWNRGASGPHPPSLVVLVARAIDDQEPSSPTGPAFRASAKPRRQDMDAYLELARAGFEVTWTRAGVAAVHPGPAGHLLDPERLHAVARAVGDLAAAAPAAPSTPAPVAPAPTDASSLRVVLEGFLSALRDRDAVGVLAQAHPRLFSTSALEPSPLDLFAPLDDARARPVSWDSDIYVNASTGGSRTLETLARVDRSDVTCVNLAMTATCEDGTRPMNVYLLRLDRIRWRVSGLRIGAVTMGVEFPHDNG
jgi:hypothetical protein